MINLISQEVEFMKGSKLTLSVTGLGNNHFQIAIIFNHAGQDATGTPIVVPNGPKKKTDKV